MYRCIARYGYKDTRTGNVEFENQLLEFLKDFIMADYMYQVENEGNNFDNGESIVDIGALSENACTMGIVQEELDFLENGKKSGVVYLLGDSEVFASKDPKGQAALEIPNRSLLQVGMTYYI